MAKMREKILLVSLVLCISLMGTDLVTAEQESLDGASLLTPCLRN
jgi:hypothetical protein